MREPTPPSPHSHKPTRVWSVHGGRGEVGFQSLRVQEVQGSFHHREMRRGGAARGAAQVIPRAAGGAETEREQRRCELAAWKTVLRKSSWSLGPTGLRPGVQQVHRTIAFYAFQSLSPRRTQGPEAELVEPAGKPPRCCTHGTLRAGGTEQHSEASLTHVPSAAPCPVPTPCCSPGERTLSPDCMQLSHPALLFAQSDIHQGHTLPWHTRLATRNTACLRHAIWALTPLKCSGLTCCCST